MRNKRKWPGRRMCWMCGEQPAAILAHQSDEIKEPVFCSPRCAIAAALMDFSNRQILWCSTHEDWTGDGGDCDACIIDALAEAAAMKDYALDAQAAERGSANE